jgi:hypothetical protein
MGKCSICEEEFQDKYFDYQHLFNIINPIWRPVGGTTLDIFIFKVIVAYLIYQFIVSVRQNTRRK